MDNKDMSKNQKGFALVESILILIVIGILAGTGWYVWNSRSKSNKSLDNSAKTSVSTKVPVKTNKNMPADANATAGWLVYKDTDNDFSFSYPPSWKATPSSYSQQTIIITSPDLKEESREPFSSGTSVTGGSRISLLFITQTGKTLDEITASSFPTYNGSSLKKETRQIDGARAYELEYGYDAPTARNIIFIKGTQYYIRGSLEGLDVSKTSTNYDTFIKILDSVVVK